MLRNTEIITFGEKIKHLRIDANISLRELSKLIEVDYSLLAKIENDKRKPSISVVDKIAKYYKIHKQDLIATLLSDKIAYEIINSNLDTSILVIAEEKVNYLRIKSKSK